MAAVSGDVLCEGCQLQGAALHCQQCQGDLCSDCVVHRHRDGTLAQHTFTVFGAALPFPKRIGAPCSYCNGQRATTVFCPPCAVVFCGPCSSSFHNFGALLAHITVFSDRVELDAAACKPIDTLITGTDSPLQSTDVITLKVAAFGIAVSADRLEHVAEKGLGCYLTINCDAQVFRLYCKGDELQQYEFSRPFDDLLNATTPHLEHPNLISVQFKSFSMTADILMMRDTESRQLIQLVQQIRKKQCAFPIRSIESLGSDVVTFKGFAQKRGKIAWSLRYLVVSGHMLFVYRDERSDMALNSIDLIGSPAFKTASKQLTIGGTEREFVFRLKTKNQTDLLNAILQHCHGIIENADIGNHTTAIAPKIIDSPRGSAQPRLSSMRSSVSPSPHAPRFRRTTSQTATNLFTRGCGEIFPKEQLAMQFEDELDKIRLGFNPTPPKMLVAGESDPLAQDDIMGLLQVLLDSMENGAALTSGLYVPAAIWSQNSGGKLLAYGVKRDNFALLRERLEQVEFDDESGQVLDPKSLEVLALAYDTIQTAMSLHIPYIHAVKKPVKITRTNMERFGAKIKKYGHSVVKKATRATSSTQKVSDPSDYSQLVRDILTLSLQLLRRCQVAPSEELGDGISDVLSRAQAFNRDVLCSILVEDLRLDMHRCMKRESSFILD